MPVAGCVMTRRGYGGIPHGSEAKRREGYPSGQTVPPETTRSMRPARPWSATVATSRTGSSRANDAASRPEKPAVQGISPALFLPASEKSSIKSIACESIHRMKYD